MTDHRPLGPTGLTIAPLVLGAMNFANPTPADESATMIARALDAGISMIDLADVYGAGESERVVGDALAASGRRDDVLLATKFGWPRPGDEPGFRHRRDHIVESCEQSLRSLRTDRIDLLQVHRPSDVVAQEETLAALDELVRAGKVRFVGTSTHPAWMVMEAIAIAERNGAPRVVSEQPPYNLLDRRIEHELVPLALRYDVAILPWSPLAGGILAGRYPTARTEDLPPDSRAARSPQRRVRVTDAGVAIAHALAVLASERGLSTAQLALLWVKDQPGVTAPIIGPRTLAQLDDALGVLDRTLDDEARAACDALVPPGTTVVDFHDTSGWTRPRA